MNTLKTGLLLILLTVLFVGIGGAFFGQGGMIIAFAIAVLMNAFSYWFSDKIVLAMYRAKEVSEEEMPTLYRTVRELTDSHNLPMPRLYVIPSDASNAFATGRNPQHAAVAVTSGIMNVLDWNELRGVIAHELSHVRNRDILISTIVAVLAGAIMMLGWMLRWGAILGGGGNDRRNPFGMIALLLVGILAPIAAVLVQLWISRTREYAADESGARMAGNGRDLANALRKLTEASRYRRLKAGPSTAHLFIVNPLSGKSLASLFSTHPPMEERIRRLESMRF